ncbi:MAG: bifunctional (p)ppGpp synthetase/guanosine-3',5'-bis(diphosphate) 3'-pyrophosphohydrolase [Bacilli bacterium]
MTSIVEITSIDELLVNIKHYNKVSKELKIIKKAFLFAKEKHYGKKRLTGDDYIIHPLNVANILVTIQADYVTISAALLHAVIEECNTEASVLTSEFGEEITSIIVGFTKINKLSFDGNNEAMVINHQKILVGLSQDVRVIFLKLADRLHNMRTLWVMDIKLQKATAKETLDILVPIAHRLGINRLKSELEDLSLRYYKPDVYFAIVEKLNQSKKERDDYVLKMQDKVTSLLTSFHIKHEIKGRAKSIYSIYNKLNTGRSFNQIYDLLALRIFVNSSQECYQVLGIIHSKFRPIPKRFKDYIAMPKTNMYQSLHTTVFGIDGYLFEIQIRTYEMDKVAEIGIASHCSYKEGKVAVQNAMEQKLQFFRSIMELKDQGESDEEFVKSVKHDIFDNTIYVFTPKGDVIELPVKATPIDFAYKVHSSVGDKMVGALVNDKIVPLDYELFNNDIVKINTNNNSSGPSREWLNIVKTTQAKNKIKNFFNKLDKEEYLKIGEDLLNKTLRKKKIVNEKFFNSTNLDKLLKNLKCSNLDELLVNIGNRKFSPNQVINIIYNDNKTKEEIILASVKEAEIVCNDSSSDIIVKGIDHVKINIASCCKPIVNDDIIGYITKGSGITVHRSNCPNVSNLTERIIDVFWNDNVSKKYATNLIVHTNDDNNILMDIIVKTANKEITVQNVSSKDRLYDIEVIVASCEKLNKFIDDIMQIPSVTAVKRAIK